MRVCPSFAYDSFHRNHTLRFEGLIMYKISMVRWWWWCWSQHISGFCSYACALTSHANNKATILRTFMCVCVCSSFQLAWNKLFAFCKTSKWIIWHWAHTFLIELWIMCHLVICNILFAKNSVFPLPHCLIVINKSSGGD